MTLSKVDCKTVEILYYYFFFSRPAREPCQRVRRDHPSLHNSCLTPPSFIIYKKTRLFCMLNKSKGKWHGKCKTVIFSYSQNRLGIHAFKQTCHVNQKRLVKAPNKFLVFDEISWRNQQSREGTNFVPFAFIPSGLSPQRRLPLRIPIEKRALCVENSANWRASGGLWI